MIKLSEIMFEGSEMMWFTNPGTNQMTNPNKDFPYHPAMDRPELRDDVRAGKSKIMKLTDIIDDVIEATTPAGEEAAKMGLTHKGYGNYGPEGGDTTHKSKGDRLVPVGQDKPSGEQPQAQQAEPTVTIDGAEYPQSDFTWGKEVQGPSHKFLATIDGTDAPTLFIQDMETQLEKMGGGMKLKGDHGFHLMDFEVTIPDESGGEWTGGHGSGPETMEKFLDQQGATVKKLDQEPQEGVPGSRLPILAQREGVDYTYIKMADLLRETVEVIEVIEFYKRANDDQKIEFERLWNAGEEEELQALIDTVTRSNLVGFNRGGDSFSLGRPGWRPSRKGAS